MKARSLLALLLTLGLLALGCSDDGGSTAGDGTWPDSITFGFVPSSEQEALQDNIQPFMDVVSETLGIEVNGVVTTDVKDSVDPQGYIALQHHGEKGQVYRFRNIRIQEITAADPKYKPVDEKKPAPKKKPGKKNRKGVKAGKA